MARSCGGRCLAAAVRVSNFVVMLIGLTLVGYAIYMVIQAKAISSLSGTVLGLGIVDATLGLLLLSCGYSSLFYLRLYAFIVGLLELAQIAVAALFLSPTTQSKILDAINPPADLRGEIEANLAVSGWVLLAVVAFQALTLALVLIQSCSIDSGFDEREYDTESLLGGGRGGGYKGSSGAGGGRKSDRFGALDDEVATAAASRYREKAGRFYQKYGIK